jgi:phosphoribosylformimino-5-aminoimidazole carboxamide ribotide isomerase
MPRPKVSWRAAAPSDAPRLSRFTLFPAIDLRRGRCVRLERGEADRETVYGGDPLEVARGFAGAGAEWLHVVDLDAAFGEGDNRAIIATLAEKAGLRVQTGGGLRTLDALDAALRAGAERAVIGTAAIEQPELVGQAIGRWGAERIAVGLDARGRRPAVRGWRDETDADLFQIAASLTRQGVRTLIYTDIERDGMMAGPNLDTAVALAEHTRAGVIVSGGIGGPGDVAAAARHRDRGVVGAILGRALYEGRVSLAEALRTVRG